MIRATTDTHITVKIADLPKSSLEEIQGALDIPNPERENARRQSVYGWQQMDQVIRLWDIDGDELIMPRGFALRFKEGMKRKGVAVDWQDMRREVPSAKLKDARPIALRDYQRKAISRMADVQQGIYQAPPGAGKTVAVLESIRRHDQRSLVIVGKIDIAEQWRERARDFLGIEAGLVGDGVWEEADLTIATQQTLWSKRDELEEKKWWETWGFVCLDEMHHLPASTFRDVLARFPAKYRFGVSATPDLHADWLPVAIMTVGEIFHETTYEELEEAGVTVRPSVRVVDTDFDFEYRGNSGRKRNNYSEMMGAIADDLDRAQLIVDCIRSDMPHHHLVISERLAHIELLRKLLEPEGLNLHILTGSQKRGERRDIVKQIEKSEYSVTISTVAKEALDVPVFDRLHLAWPFRNPKSGEQMLGRIRRIAAGKTEAIVYDYLDRNVSLLRSQFGDRRRELYEKSDIDVEFLRDEQKQGSRQTILGNL